MWKLEQKKQIPVWFPHLKPKSINDNAKFTLQLLRKTINSITNKCLEPQPTEMASKMLPPQRIRRLNTTTYKTQSLNQSYNLEHLQQSKSIIRCKPNKSPNLPINSSHLLCNKNHNFHTIDVSGRYQNLKNRALSLKYAKRTYSLQKYN